MGWKTINGRQYYYTSRRVAGQVVTDYIGPDFLGDRAERESKARSKQRRREWAKQAQALKEDQVITDICNLARDFTKAALILAGWRLHKGEWRKARRHE